MFYRTRARNKKVVFPILDNAFSVFILMYRAMSYFVEKRHFARL